MRSSLLLICYLLSTQVIAAEENIVILLSWDGMRHDFPDKGDYPGLKRIEMEGIRAGKLTPVSPSNTFPGHVSLATGTTPDIHGIVDNVFYDRERGSYAYSSDASWLRAEPLWIAAERQGVKTATYFWVGSESDWQGQGTSYRIAPFANDRPEADKVDQMIQWLDLPKPERPRLIMSYWRGADSVAHLKGPTHPDVADIINQQDVELQRLMTALDERNLWSITTLIIVSDHGMTEVTESVAVKQQIIDAGLDVRITGGDSAQHIFLSDQSDRAAIKKILAAQTKIKVYEGTDVPAGLNAENRTGDIVITTEPPYTLRAPETLVEHALVRMISLFGWQRGAHGFDPNMPDMGGIFLAKGYGVEKGKQIDELHHLDVAPTVTKLLGIEKPNQAIREGLNLN